MHQRHQLPPSDQQQQHGQPPSQPRVEGGPAAPPTPPRSTSISSQQQQPPPPSSQPASTAAATATATATATAPATAAAPSSFARRKAAILAQLALPDDEYADLSPKGTVDAGVRGLIGEINAREGLVTTSSCAGRVSVFLEGRRAGGGGGGGGEKDLLLPGHPFAVDEEGAAAAGADVAGGDEQAGGEGFSMADGRRGGGRGGHDGDEDDDDDDDDDDGVGGGGGAVRTVAGVGGKGGGGRWLFVSHDPVETHGKLDSEPNIVAALLGMEEPIFDGREGSSAEEMSGGGSRLIHFKFEPMILHVLTASPQHAQLLLRCGLQAGFRESGAINLLPPPSSPSSPATPMVAIRSMGLGLESLIGRETNGTKHCTVSGEYLKALIKIANERFVENARRIERFRALLGEAAGDDVAGARGRGRRAGAEWEDAGARRERKRAEGLRRAEEVRRLKEEQRGGPAGGDVAGLEGIPPA